MKRDPAIVSKTMSHIRGRDTGIELKVRKRLREAGISYRTCCSSVFGRPDIVLHRYRIAIFCDSEFWHGYQFEENKAKLVTHTDYWIPKIQRNIARDIEVNEKLKEQGYAVLRFWGHEIEKDLDSVMNRIFELIEKRRWMAEMQAKIKARTTLVYVDSGDSYLLLHRVKKKQDINTGKWIGVGGHLEPNESVVACMKREVWEETGLFVDDYHYFGSIDFLNDECEPERMFLYSVTKYHGELIENDEGILAWVKKEEMFSLPMWEGDAYFLPSLNHPEKKPFRMVLIYRGGDLQEVIGPYWEERKKHGRKRKPKHK